MEILHLLMLLLNIIFECLLLFASRPVVYLRNLLLRRTFLGCGSIRRTLCTLCNFGSLLFLSIICPIRLNGVPLHFHRPRQPPTLLYSQLIYF